MPPPPTAVGCGCVGAWIARLLAAAAAPCVCGCLRIPSVSRPRWSPVVPGGPRPRWSSSPVAPSSVVPSPVVPGGPGGPRSPRTCCRSASTPAAALVGRAVGAEAAHGAPVRGRFHFPLSACSRSAALAAALVGRAVGAEATHGALAAPAMGQALRAGCVGCRDRCGGGGCCLASVAVPIATRQARLRLSARRRRPSCPGNW
jgi:hypothetical protein